jgi:hypothetical protein
LPQLVTDLGIRRSIMLHLRQRICAQRSTTNILIVLREVCCGPPSPFAFAPFERADG